VLGFLSDLSRNPTQAATFTKHFVVVIVALTVCFILVCLGVILACLGVVMAAKEVGNGVSPTAIIAVAFFGGVLLTFLSAMLTRSIRKQAKNHPADGKPGTGLETIPLTKNPGKSEKPIPHKP
jgi:hypothetical protein